MRRGLSDVTEPIVAADVPWLTAYLDRPLARLVDHTLLKPGATSTDYDRLCAEAVEFGFRAICVHANRVQQCLPGLEGSGVIVASVVDFPLGGGLTKERAREAERAVTDGARELDVVIALKRAHAGEWDAVMADLKSVVYAAGGVPVKAILESALLSHWELIEACKAARSAGAAGVKTSTGFHSAGGATIDAVRTMRETVGLHFGVKASGGIKTPVDALAMLKAGADRIGASAAAGGKEVATHLRVLLEKGRRP